MRKKSLLKLSIFFLFCISQNLFCESINSNTSPWFTGPILAPSGKTIPLGHFNFENYGFFTDANRFFTDRGRIVSMPSDKSWQENPILTYGLMKGVDVQMSLPMSLNYNEGQIGRHIGDAAVQMGFQVLEQHTYWWPNFRLTLQQIFPTGRFDDMNPTDKGTGVTGSGAYQSVVSLNFQELFQLTNVNYLRTRLSLGYLWAYPFNVFGYTGYFPGGKVKGQIRQGNLFSQDLAAEFTVTQHWVAVMEGYAIERKGTTFIGQTDITPTRNPPVETIHKRDILEVSLAPALEYNFNENVGIITGYWFAVYGKNSPDFDAWTVALNIFW